MPRFLFVLLAIAELHHIQDKKIFPVNSAVLRNYCFFGRLKLKMGRNNRFKIL
ncbi:hypothetical protein CES86_4558 [Brucella lupini]|uniref:Uncharacterized protein n=1 Tax=Brucella lupini TaxID=255457 RepID=A0A256GB13_9HYPH|nr:hypothetical protein CES86_4558 [Brucella lupini]